MNGYGAVMFARDGNQRIHGAGVDSSNARSASSPAATMKAPEVIRPVVGVIEPASLVPLDASEFPSA
jgi:hypothetical protein